MTLVIVKNDAGKLRLEADTKLTTDTGKGLARNSNERQSIPGILKLYIISDNYCLGFAGVHEYALNALREIASDGAWENEVIIRSIILDAQREFPNENGGTDFLLCNRISRIATLWRNGSELSTRENCFIGDATARKSIDPESRNRRSIDDLISNEDFEGIGGLAVGVVDNGKAFRYENRLGVYFQRKEEAHPSNGFIYTTVAPNESKPLLGIYFQERQFGYIYNPIENDFAMRVNEPTIDRFKSSAGWKDAISIEARLMESKNS